MKLVLIFLQLQILGTITCCLDGNLNCGAGAMPGAQALVFMISLQNCGEVSRSLGEEFKWSLFKGRQYMLKDLGTVTAWQPAQNYSRDLETHTSALNPEYWHAWTWLLTSSQAYFHNTGLNNVISQIQTHCVITEVKCTLTWLTEGAKHLPFVGSLHNL